MSFSSVYSVLSLLGECFYVITQFFFFWFTIPGDINNILVGFLYPSYTIMLRFLFALASFLPFP